MGKDYSAITPKILELSELCKQASSISPEMFTEHKVSEDLEI